MAHSRTWRLGLNLDQFNTLMRGLKTMREQSDFLDGLCDGMNLVGARKNPSQKWMTGYIFGAEMREETEAYRENRRANGVKGGRPPKKPHGSEMVTISKPYGEAQQNPSEQHFFQDNPQQSTSPSAQLCPSALDEQVQKILQEWNSMAQRVGIHQSRGVGPILKTLRQKVKQPGWVDLFLGALPFIEGSPFYHGKNDRGWKANLDWLLRPGKVEELTGREPEKPKNGTASHRQATDDAFLAQLKEAGMA